MKTLNVIYRWMLVGLLVIGLGACVDAPPNIAGAVHTRSQGLTVEANRTLFAPGRYNAPALVIFSTNPQVSLATLKGLAEKAYALKDKTPSDPGEAALARTMADETYRRGHIERYPPTVAGNADTYLAHVMIRRSALSEGMLRGRPLVFDLYTVEGAPVRLDLVGEQR